ncbi:arginase family protein [Agromyces sp. LHK192]|uniref:arginase family protein n=1 Tax=Agromyces sp. LHK192 TaxID=2498704 RepID=UPI000FD7D124|nr:arginase family protein [Agromyces sp. LHK192]
MPATFVVVPVWQGSVSARAMSHADGADAIRGDLPAAATVVVEVPAEAGESLDTGVRRYSALQRMRERTAQALDPVDGLAVVVGGDCSAAIAGVGRAARRTGGDLAVLWLDAHPDLNTPDSSPSGAFGGMVLRAVAGEGADGLRLEGDERVDPARIVLGGIRAMDDAEQEFIDAHGVTVLAAAQVGDPVGVIAALEATGASNVYVHVDLDVLDPSALAGLSYPMPFGVSAADLVQSVRSVVERFPLAGASIAGFAPRTPEAAEDDLPTILRLVGALSAPVARPEAD